MPNLRTGDRLKAGTSTGRIGTRQPLARTIDLSRGVALHHERTGTLSKADGGSASP